jgi:subtilisin family serine protease
MRILSNEERKAMYRKIFNILLVLVLTLSGSTAAFAQENAAPPAQGEYKSYIVVLKQDPILAYTGTTSGFASTEPGAENRIAPQSANVNEYEEFLVSEHNQSLEEAGVGADAKVHDYTFALNGYSAIMTQEQAEAIELQKDVVLVLEDQLRYPQTDNTPTFLGLTVRGGAYDSGYTGEDVVVGVIDSGIWPEHPSFADDGSYGPSPVPPLDETERSACDFGNTAHNPNDAPFTCNNKLLGARQFMDTYDAVFGITPEEFDSARDDDGHGTHTASTSAGNAGVPASIFGIPRGTISGIAPRARVIAYKGLGIQGGFGSDLAAAIDQAVADGVDVINYSIGGGASLTGADDIAFLFAADAGVFVANSAGNEGPDPGTIGGPASVPWITSVGASTHSRAFISDITLRGPGRPPKNLWGGSITTGIKNYNLVDADAVAGGTNGECLEPFPAGTFQANDAVLCNRYNFGVARTTRVANVAAGGGGAVILHNVALEHPNMTPTDNHPLPTVHMLYDVGQPLKDYLVAHPGRVKVSFTQSESRYAPKDKRVIPNVMASFSSRGPDPVAEDIIKPDVTAPGINILAGASPIHVNTAAQGELFQAIMGTSMSGPHVAGIFALLKQAHPEWSAAAAKSALMTTARQNVLKNDFKTPADPFDMGAGHVDPGGKWRDNGSLNKPGLVYDAGFNEYLGFLCDEAPEVFANPAATCAALEAAGIPTEAHNLNYPSIGVAEVAGTQTVIRTVTSVADRRVRFEAKVKEPEGYDITVNPRHLTLNPGESATFEVTITNKDAPIGEWRFGSLTWKGSDYDVYSPIALRAALFSAPAEVDGSGESGSASFDVQFGYTGSYTAAAHGLVPATVITDNVVQDPDQNFDPSDGFSDAHTFDLSGAAFFRIAIPPEATEANADLDVYVFDPNNELVASSTLGGTDEQVDIFQPADGTWTVYVHGWSTPGGDSDYDMYSWIISATPGGNLTIDSAPTSATSGAIETISVSWTGATLGQWHLGAVSHTGDVGLMGLTLINVDNR